MKNALPIKKIFIASLVILVTFVLSLGIWVLNLDRQIDRSLQSEWFVPPIEIYTAPKKLVLGGNARLADLTNELKHSGYRERALQEALFVKDFTRSQGTLCSEMVSEPPESFILTEDTQCLLIKKYEGYFQLITIEQNTVTGLYEGALLKQVDSISLNAELFAQFYDDQPIIRKITALEDFPLACLNAVLAIEDHRFLEHQGISIPGMARAVFDLLRSGRFRSGGSTITQQLVKNYFLTSEKTLSRKFTEIFMALILENKVDKERILESYLNVIYMGQNGPFQVRGFTAAAEYYFNKPIAQLNTAECGLLAGILNSPGRFNPFRKPENAIARRDKVLSDMLKYSFIDEVEYEKSKLKLIPINRQQKLPNPAPYFVDAIRKEVKKMGIDIDQGLRIYTTLDTDTQDLADSTLNQTLTDLENRHKMVQKNKQEGKTLQSMMVVVDVRSGEIRALMGGRDYRKSQYNRAVDGHRQVGSVMKPLVYLTALESTKEDGSNYSPTTIIEDKKFSHKYDGQVWSPNNYSREFHGSIPMYFALKNSINSATAQLGLNVGLENIIETARRLGITSELDPVPALTLGAFELYPFEVAQAYLTIARLGEHTPLHSILRVESLDNELLYEYEPKFEPILSPEVTSQLVGMMKQTVESGTAKWMRRVGFKKIAAGKTGTTSDSKDAWFVGFTPKTLVVVWTGYDDNTPHKLTGSSGALPVWYNFMRQYNEDPGLLDFPWPDSVRTTQIDPKWEYETLDSAKHLAEDPVTELIVPQ